jgi:hypothetical protein
MKLAIHADMTRSETSPGESGVSLAAPGWSTEMLPIVQFRTALGLDRNWGPGGEGQRHDQV